jgi:hypothetical protein
MTVGLIAVIVCLVVLECLTLYTLGVHVDRIERVQRSHDEHLGALNRENAIQSRRLDDIRARLDDSRVSVNGAERPTPIHGKRIRPIR